MAEALEALVVRPGDTLILRIDPGSSRPDYLDELKAVVEERLPGVKSLFLGVDQIGVYRPELADG